MSNENRQCLCGHERRAHDHYRSGSDCSHCVACTLFRTAHPVPDLLRLLRRSGPDAAPERPVLHLVPLG